MTQPSLFGLPPSTVVLVTGPDLRDRGHEKVSAVDPEMSQLCLDILRQVCQGRDTVTSDDFWAHLKDQSLQDHLVAHPNLVGAAFRALACAGVIHDSGRCVKTTRLSGQGRKLTLWDVTR